MFVNCIKLLVDDDVSIVSYYPIKILTIFNKIYRTIFYIHPILCYSFYSTNYANDIFPFYRIEMNIFVMEFLSLANSPLYFTMSLKVSNFIEPVGNITLLYKRLEADTLILLGELFLYQNVFMFERVFYKK